MKITFTVYGTPKPGGSKKAFVSKTGVHAGRAIIVDDCATSKDWRRAVMLAAREAMAQSGQGKILGPVSLDVTFFMPRPRGHYGTGKNENTLKNSAPFFHTKKPDRTKLLRSTEDALTDAGIWRDDTQVCDGPVRKVYAGCGDAARAEIEITTL